MTKTNTSTTYSWSDLIDPAYEQIWDRVLRLQPMDRPSSIAIKAELAGHARRESLFSADPAMDLDARVIALVDLYQPTLSALFAPHRLVA